MSVCVARQDMKNYNNDQTGCGEGKRRKGGDAERVSGGTLKSDKFSVRQHACLSERESEREAQRKR